MRSSPVCPLDRSETLDSDDGMKPLSGRSTMRWIVEWKRLYFPQISDVSPLSVGLSSDFHREFTQSEGLSFTAPRATTTLAAGGITPSW